MDRYSQLQQLSRALFESASDLLDLKETLAAKNRDAETLLLQQARVNTELQEGLMRTRMVPFDRLVPRLRRIVRQVAGELGKQVEFVVGNADGEMDRTVLERIVAPLEHMLRNAVDHGIESGETPRGGQAGARYDPPEHRPRGRRHPPHPLRRRRRHPPRRGTAQGHRAWPDERRQRPQRS